MNTGLAFPVAAARTVPYATLAQDLLCSKDRKAFCPVRNRRQWPKSCSLVRERWAGESSPISTLPLDTFGIGYSHVEYSTPLQNLAPVRLPIGNDDAVEVFYNIAVTPWFRLTPDLQSLMPARDRTFPPDATAIDTAVVFALRGKIEF